MSLFCLIQAQANFFFKKKAGRVGIHWILSLLLLLCDPLVSPGVGWASI